MNDNILVRAIGEIEVYQFMENIEEFTEFYNANSELFDIFEIANIKEVEKTEINKEYTLYDVTLKNTEDHLWLIKDEQTGMYEALADEDQAQNIMQHLQGQNN